MWSNWKNWLVKQITDAAVLTTESILCM